MTIQDESILLEVKADSEKEFYVGEWKNIPKGYLAVHLQVTKKWYTLKIVFCVSIPVDVS